MSREQLVKAVVYVMSLPLLGAVGCDTSAPSSPPAVQRSFHHIEQRMGDVVVKKLTAHWARRGGPLELVILCDFYGESSISRGGSDRKVSGQSTAYDGRRVEWEWQATDGKIGTVVINGQKYDRAEGGLFLVYTEGDKPRVVQLKREFSGGVEILDGLAETDSDIMAFVAEADAWMP